MSWKLSNFASSTLRQSLALAATTAYIDADEVDDLPALGVGDKAKAVLFNSDYCEIVNITAWNTDGTLTIERAQESTAARDWESGTKIIHTPTAELLEVVINASIAATSKFSGTATNVGDLYTVDVGVGNTLPNLFTGDRLTFLIPADNTGPVTVNVTDGTTTIDTKSVLFMNGQPLEAGAFAADWLADLHFDATEDAWYLVESASYQQHATQINDGPLPGVSRHPNGRLDFWRGGVTFNTPASLAETADGWYPEYDGTISAFSITRQTFTLGQTDVPGDPRYFLRWDQSAAGSGSTLRRLRVPLPGVHWRAGETVTRSVWLKADTARTVVAKLIQDFGTGGSPSADVEADTENLSVTDTWQRFDITVTLPAITGKTIGSGVDDALVLTLDLPLNVTMTIDVANDDIRPGTIPGLQSDTWPVPWWLGGTGGSYQSQADFISDLTLYTTSSWATANPDLVDIEALAGTEGGLFKIGANDWALRELTVGTSLIITNPNGVAGDPLIELDPSLEEYAADPLSVSELASVTGDFGTAAFVADSGLLHVAGAEDITGDKTITGTQPRLLFEENDQAVDEKLWDVTVTGGDLQIRTRTDADAAGVNALSFTRGTGTALTNLTLGTVVIAPNGAVGAPAYSFAGSATSGMYYVAGEVAFANGGVAMWYFNGARLNSVIPLWGPAGSASAPTFALSTNTDVGMYFPTTTSIGWTIDNSLKMDLSATRLLMGSAVDIQLNAATVPGSVTSVGFRGVPSNSGEKAANFTGVAVDAGAAVPFTATAQYTIPANSAVPHPLGTVIMLPSLNGGGNLTVHPDTGVTLRRGDGTAGTGDRVVAANASAWIWKRGTNEWYIFGLFT